MAELKLYSGEYVKKLLDEKQQKLTENNFGSLLSKNFDKDGNLENLNATLQSDTYITTVDAAEIKNNSAITSNAVAVIEESINDSLDKKQDVLTSANAGDNVTITTDKEGKVKINATGGGGTIDIDKEPITLSDKAVSSGGVYDSIHGTFEGYPKKVVQGGIADFEQFQDKTGQKPFVMNQNDIFVIWDNDLAERYGKITVPSYFAPKLFANAQIQIFNHGDAEGGKNLNIEWPSNWRWYDNESHKYLINGPKPVIPPCHGACITLIHSCDFNTCFNCGAGAYATNCILAKLEYLYELDKNNQDKLYFAGPYGKPPFDK